MSSSPLREASVELAWSLWTELGVPGVVRNHRDIVIDPEPLALWSASIVADDPRLRDLVFSWCASYGGRLSTSRLRALSRTLPDSARRNFAGLARALALSSAVRWPSGTGAEDWSRPTEQRDVPLPIERPSLLRFRLRALAGVGARADTLHHLLTAWPDPVSAADVAATGYGQRNVSRLLAELADARILSSRRRGNRLDYHLRAPAMLGRLVGAGDARDVPWVDIFDVLARVLDLEASWSQRPAASQRIQAHKVRSEIEPTAVSVRLAVPPITEGNKEALPALLDWARFEVSRLADGTASALAARSGWTVGSGSGAGSGDGYGAGAADGSGFGFGCGYGEGAADGDGWGDGLE